MPLLTPLDVAQILDHSSSRDLPRDPETGLYIADGTEPPTELTRPMYEAALAVREPRDHPGAKR